MDRNNRLNRNNRFDPYNRENLRGHLHQLNIDLIENEIQTFLNHIRQLLRLDLRYNEHQIHERVAPLYIGILRSDEDRFLPNQGYLRVLQDLAESLGREIANIEREILENDNIENIPQENDENRPPNRSPVRSPIRQLNRMVIPENDENRPPNRSPIRSPNRRPLGEIIRPENDENENRPPNRSPNRRPLAEIEVVPNRRRRRGRRQGRRRGFAENFRPENVEINENEQDNGENVRPEDVAPEEDEYLDRRRRHNRRIFGEISNRQDPSNP